MSKRTPKSWRIFTISSMLLSIVTLNYKKKELTLDCVDSLVQQFVKEFSEDKMELIIVDNDSQDDSVSVMRAAIKDKQYKNVQVIAHPSNAGFGAGCNVGAAVATGDYILFLNNDTVVQDSGIWNMVQYLHAHPDIAILGGKLHNADGSVQASSGNFYTLWYATLLLFGGQKFGPLDKSPTSIQKVDWVKGALLLIRRKAFEELGGFDEKIFMYTEDMELCYRAHMAGKRIYFYPDVQIVHKEHGSANRTFAIVNIYKNLLYFYKKHRSPTEYRILKTLMQAKAMFVIGIGKLLGKSELVATYQSALAAITT